jgi:hypothetical protein
MAKLDHIQDIENSPRDDYHEPDSKPILEPQLNVGGHGATQRRLRNYHVTMIGICSGIGTGLFIGTGAAYANAGPAGLLLAYIIVGSVLWCVMQSIAELATVVSSLWHTIAGLHLRSFRFLQLVHSHILQAASSTQLLVSLWLSVTDTVTPYQSLPNAQHQPFLSGTGPIYPPPWSSQSVLSSFLPSTC